MFAVVTCAGLGGRHQSPLRQQQPEQQPPWQAALGSDNPSQVLLPAAPPGGAFGREASPELLPGLFPQVNLSQPENQN